MTFLSTLALAAALLVVVPYVAHRLRRRRAEEDAVRPGTARRAVAPEGPAQVSASKIARSSGSAWRPCSLLALLGATPFVRCSRLSLQRSGGASVAMAIVVDDSMSMRALSNSRSRFDQAREGARDLLASA